MSGSLGKSESSNRNQFNSENQAQNQSQFGQNVWGPQGGALQNLYGQMGNLFDQTNQGMQTQIPGATQGMQGIFNASQNPWQQQMQGGSLAGMDLQGNFQNAFDTGGGNEQFIDQSIMGGQGNDYVGALKDQMQADSDKRLGRSFAGADARASGAGMGGSSRHGLLQARLAEDEGDRLGDQQTRLGFQTFDRDLDRKLGIAQRADRFDMDRMNTASGMLNSANQNIQGGLNMGGQMQGLNMGQFAPGMAPWEAAGQYSGNLGGPTVLGSGSSSGSSSGSGSGFGSGSSKGFGASGGAK